MKRIVLLSTAFVCFYSPLYSMEDSPAGSACQSGYPQNIVAIVHHARNNNSHATQLSVGEMVLAYLHQTYEQAIIPNALSSLLSQHAELPVNVHAIHKSQVLISFTFPTDQKVISAERWYELNELIHLLTMSQNKTMHPVYKQSASSPATISLSLSTIQFPWRKNHIADSTYMANHNSLMYHSPILQRLLDGLKQEEQCSHAQCDLSTANAPKLNELLDDYQYLVSIAPTIQQKIILKRVLLVKQCPAFSQTLFGNDYPHFNNYDEVFKQGNIAHYIQDYFVNTLKDDTPTPSLFDPTNFIGLTSSNISNQERATMVLNINLFKNKYADPLAPDAMIQFIREFLFL